MTLAEADILAELVRYLPELVRRQVAVAPSGPSTPRYESFPAAALFADRSGFTGLTERLAERGEIGVEALTEALNDFFGRSSTGATRLPLACCERRDQGCT
jgi:hypothetical protein